MMNLWKYLGIATFWLTFPLIWVYVRFTPPRARVLIVHNGSVLLVRNWLGTGKWTLPGGGINKGERPIEAAVRELHEELGLLITSSQLKALGQREVHENRGLLTRHYLFVAEFKTKPELHAAMFEIIDHAWVDTGNIAANPQVVVSVTDALLTWKKG